MRTNFCLCWGSADWLAVQLKNTDPLCIVWKPFLLPGPPPLMESFQGKPYGPFVEKLTEKEPNEEERPRFIPGLPRVSEKKTAKFLITLAKFILLTNPKTWHSVPLVRRYPSRKHNMSRLLIAATRWAPDSPSKPLQRAAQFRKGLRLPWAPEVFLVLYENTRGQVSTICRKRLDVRASEPDRPKGSGSWEVE